MPLLLVPKNSPGFHWNFNFGPPEPPSLARRRWPCCAPCGFQALCVDYDGTGNSYELGDSGRRVYVTGVTGFVESGRIFKDLQQRLGWHI